MSRFCHVVRIRVGVRRYLRVVDIRLGDRVAVFVDGAKRTFIEGVAFHADRDAAVSAMALAVAINDANSVRFPVTAYALGDLVTVVAAPGATLGVKARAPGLILNTLPPVLEGVIDFDDSGPAPSVSVEPTNDGGYLVVFRPGAGERMIREINARFPDLIGKELEILSGALDGQMSRRALVAVESMAPLDPAGIGLVCCRADGASEAA